MMKAWRLYRNVTGFRWGIFMLIAGLLTAFTVQTKKIKVYLIGDSTISNKAVHAFPETGWGMPFAHFFDSSVVVENHAMNGRSTRTFISENRWSPIADALSEGDYVFIQFGHNDESKEKTDRYTTPEEYKANLVKFITETRIRKATPILLTPVSRRKFTDGKAVETHMPYSQLVREVAHDQKALFIDLDRKSQQLLEEFGEEKSKLLFLHLQPGEHPNYPEGKTDNTHFSELGARLIAQIVLKEIVEMKIELSNRIVKPVKKS